MVNIFDIWRLLTGDGVEGLSLNNVNGSKMTWFLTGLTRPRSTEL